MLHPDLFADEPAPERQTARKSAQQEYRERQLASLPTPADYRPDPPPELRGETRIILNAETDGLEWWGAHRPIGWSWCLPESGRSGYLPMRHRPGGNLGVEQVHAFLRDVRDMHVDNINTRFDIHMARADGVDLTEQGNTFGDVAHQAALLDDHRMRFKLDLLSLDILGWNVETDGLGKIPPCITGEVEFQFIHPSIVAPYAVRNVEQVRQLIEAFAPLIREENLEAVLDLEQQVIPIVVEMEKNGTLLDMDLLHEWQASATRDLEEKLWFIYKETGIQLESPDSPKDLVRLFEARGIPMTARTEHGKPSFTDAVLKGIDDPCIAALRQAGQLADLKSKYLDKYAKAARSDGWLRFNMHQLRYGRSEDDKHGTVSGRFSAAGDKFGGYNPQQVVAVEKQLERGWCPNYVVRKLFIPEKGKLWLAADMMQVEYRLFAHYANDPSINAAYAADPYADYHAVVMRLLHTVAPYLNRKLVKNVNFAKIYGAGLIKFALMLGLITDAEFVMFSERMSQRDWSVLDEPTLAEAKKLNEDYNRMFPGVKPLLKKASEVAKQRGYVMTLMGRRARLTSRFYSSLNRIVQGGAADINKRVLIEVYKMRKALGLTIRLTVHDELCADLADRVTLPEVEWVLNTQYFDVRVPIFWDTKVGANWAACK